MGIVSCKLCVAILGPSRESAPCCGILPPGPCRLRRNFDHHGCPLLSAGVQRPGTGKLGCCCAGWERKSGTLSRTTICRSCRPCA